MYNYSNKGKGLPYIVQSGDTCWILAQRFRIPMQNIYTANPGVNPNQLYVGQRIFIPLARNNNCQNECITQKEVDLMKDQRSLWEEHVAWTRMAIISLVFNLPDTDFVLARLLRNATDMGNMFRPIYGEEAANTYTDLMKEHLSIAADLVKAALAGNTQEENAAERKWYANADKIAVFLNRVNPFLQREDVRNMFYRHLDLTKQEAVYMINKEYQKGIEMYDDIVKQAREIADMISEATIKLYPDLRR